MKRRQKTLSVSLVTATQPSRWEIFGINLTQCIANQTAISSVLEWIIVFHEDEGTPDYQVDVEQLKSITGIPTIHVLHAKRNVYPTIATCRNLYNAAVKHDLIIVFDDDDYYPPQRIEAGLIFFRGNKNIDIAGCPDHFFYDYDLDLYGRMEIVDTANRCTNYTMMYRKKYLRDHRYNDADAFAEERAFLNDFNERLGQIPAQFAGVQLFHRSNTFNKRRLVLTQIGKTWRILPELPEEIQVPVTFLNQLERTKAKTDIELPNPLDYDIVYYCGFQNEVFRWHPAQRNLTASEQAVIQLCSHWVKEPHNQKVLVYADLKDGLDYVRHEGVDYYNSRFFQVRGVSYPRLIMWRWGGFHPLWSLFRNRIQAKQMVLDLHDNKPIPPSFANDDTFREGDWIMVKSRSHLTKVVPQDLWGKCQIIQNGVQKQVFTQQESREEQDGDPAVKSKYRFVYTSDYQRGLIPILRYVWPHVVAKERRAELHLYYGTEGITNRQVLTEIARAIHGVVNVMDHGRVPIDIVAHAKRRAAWHLYPSMTTAETDCVSVKESMLLGCVPIMLKRDVFAERYGYHIPCDGFDEIDEQSGEYIAKHILAVMHRREEIIEAIGKTYILDWEDVARLWIETIVLGTCIDTVF